jgi:spoIIIJ-associated protein
MDGALFVDDEERAGEPRRATRADEPRRAARPGEARRPERAAEPRRRDPAGPPRDLARTDDARQPDRAGQARDLERDDEPRYLDADDQPDDDRDEDARPRAADDEKADDARRVTQSILDRMDLDARVTIREDDERVVLDIDGPDAGRAIGKKGMTLEALQFLVNKIVNREPDERRHIVLDSGDYRERHDSGLVAMAKREAKRAVSSGRAVTLEPMSARDRRVIHVSLAKFPGVSTRSEGEGADRRLQIIPARGSSGGRDRDERPGRDRPRGGPGRGRGPGRPGGPGPSQSGGERAPRPREVEQEAAPRERAPEYGERTSNEGSYEQRDRPYDRDDD